MRPEVIHVVVLVISIAFLVLVADVVPWTAAAVVAWLVTVPLFVASAIVPLPVPLRVATAALAFAWGAILLLPERSPIGPLSRAEWATQRVIRLVSAAGREAYQAGTLGDRRADLIAQLEACKPPNDAWRAATTAQMLDLRADPPQVGVGDATNRLVSWPWRVALDHRILPVRIRIDDAVRVRKLRHLQRPGFEDMTSSMRFDYYFLRHAWVRFDDLRARDGGLRRWHEEATALSALVASVHPPDRRWAMLRDLTVEVQALELEAAIDDLSAADQDRLRTAGDELRETWAALSRHDARGLALAKRDGAEGGSENRTTRVG